METAAPRARPAAGAAWTIALLIGIGVLTSCGADSIAGSPAPSTPAGRLVVGLTFAQAPPPTLHHVRLRLARPGRPVIEREQLLGPSDQTLFYVLGLEGGSWALSLTAHDAEGATLLCGATSVAVIEGTLTSVGLTLTPDAECGLAELACGDGVDDDVDGLTDCADPSCAGELCEDGDHCTWLDTCGVAGTCTAGVPAQCSDSSVCTADACVPSIGCTHEVIAGCCSADSQCDDSNPCTKDTCGADSTCGHTPVAGCCLSAAECDDSDACTVDTCASSAKCHHTPKPECCATAADCDDQAPCTVDSCVGTVCFHDPLAGCCVTDAACDDGDPCTTDSCAGNHLCVHGVGSPDSCCKTDTDCPDDGVACTTVACTSQGCTLTLNHASCSDQSPCTEDTCTSTGCASTPVAGPCDDGDPCTAGESCAGGTCGGGSAMVCDDGDACTKDACIAGVGCSFLPDLLTCFDGDPCTEDLCGPGGVCSHPFGTGACDDGNPCTEGDVCNGADVCLPGSLVPCDDGDVCTNDTCDAVMGCVSAAVLGTECVTVGDCPAAPACSLARCVLGTCHEVPRDCQAEVANKCLAAVCDPTLGCVGQGSPACDDGDTCTLDVCDPTVGCLHLPSCAPCVTHADCADSDPCTTGTCLAGACVQEANAEVCGNGLDEDCDGLTDVACVWRVDPLAGPSGDGASWSTAFATLAQASLAAAPGDQLWLRVGTFRAAEPLAPVLTVKAGVSVYGGFSGSESTALQRPTPLTPTVLDGDTDSSAGPSAGDSAHVLAGAAQAVLDGLVLRGGQATTNGGGGMWLVDAQGLTVSRCRFEANRGLVGGAVATETYVDDGIGIAFSDCTFTDNVASGDGGAVSVSGPGQQVVRFERCTWQGNRSTGGSGGALASSPNATAIEVRNGIFTANSAANRAGAVTLRGSGPVAIEDTRFEANEAKALDGGAVTLAGPAMATMTSCTFRNNSAASSGGAVRLESGSRATVMGCTFTGNSAGANGGAVSTDGSVQLELNGCVVSGNTSTKDGGGVDVRNKSALTLRGSRLSCNQGYLGGGLNVTGAPNTTKVVALAEDSLFLDNTSEWLGGGVYFGDYVLPTVARCEFRGNKTTTSSGGGMAQRTSPFSVRDSLFVGNTSLVSGGGLLLNGAETVVNTTLVGNKSKVGGGIYVGCPSTPTVPPSLTHVTVSGNEATERGGGIGAASCAVPIRNSVIFGNKATLGFPSVWGKTTTALPIVTGSCLATGYQAVVGAGDAILDPTADDPFVTGTHGELFLKHAGLNGVTVSSPCVDLGVDADATAAGIPWTQATTRSDGAPDTTPVDAGRHYY